MVLGVPLLVYWLAAAATSPESYEAALDFLNAPFIKFLLFLWLLSFYYHFLGGIRHLCWDMGWGFERPVARTTGWLVFVSAVVLTALTWMCMSLHVYVNANGGLV